jgi:hypothetical protein
VKSVRTSDLQRGKSPIPSPESKLLILDEGNAEVAFGEGFQANHVQLDTQAKRRDDQRRWYGREHGQGSGGGGKEKEETDLSGVGVDFARQRRDEGGDGVKIDDRGGDDGEVFGQAMNVA